MSNDLDLSELDIDSSLNISNLNIDELNNTPTKLDNGDIIKSNPILDNSEKLSLGLTEEQIQDFYEYLKGSKPRPDFAEKFFADCDFRIKESNQITTMMSLSFVPKLLAMQQSLVNSLSNPDTLQYLNTEDKISYLKTLNTMSSNINKISMNYTQAAKDITGLPLIYRQLLDQLLMIPGDKLDRLKVLPKLIDLPDDTWDRILEISKI